MFCRLQEVSMRSWEDTNERHEQGLRSVAREAAAHQVAWKEVIENWIFKVSPIYNRKLCNCVNIKITFIFRLAIRYIRHLQSLLEIPIPDPTQYDLSKQDPGYWPMHYYNFPDQETLQYNSVPWRHDTNLFCEPEDFGYTNGQGRIEGSLSWKEEEAPNALPYISLNLNH